jgi:hypothetical protein
MEEDVEAAKKNEPEAPRVTDTSGEHGDETCPCPQGSVRPSAAVPASLVCQRPAVCPGCLKDAGPAQDGPVSRTQRVVDSRNQMCGTFFCFDMNSSAGFRALGRRRVRWKNTYVQA